MQSIYFPMKYLNITQGVGVGTHVGSNAIDSAGKDGGIDDVYAPYDAVVKKVWNNGNSVWLESIEPVQFADGSVDFATSFYTHDNSISDVSVGRRLKQGETFYQEGTAGDAKGNHVHMEIAKGKFQGSGWYLNPYGYWVLYNSVRPESAFFLKKDTIVINGYGYNWKVIKEGNMGVFDEGARKDFEDIFFRTNSGLFKEFVGLDYRDAVYKIKDTPDFRARMYINKGDLNNFFNRIPTEQECKEFQIELGPDIAQLGGGVVHKDSTYIIFKEGKFVGQAAPNTQVLKPGNYKVN